MPLKLCWYGIVIFVFDRISIAIKHNRVTYGIAIHIFDRISVVIELKAENYGIGGANNVYFDSPIFLPNGMENATKT